MRREYDNFYNDKQLVEYIIKKAFDDDTTILEFGDTVIRTEQDEYARWESGNIDHHMLVARKNSNEEYEIAYVAPYYGGYAVYYQSPSQPQQRISIMFNYTFEE